MSFQRTFIFSSLREVKEQEDKRGVTSQSEGKGGELSPIRTVSVVLFRILALGHPRRDMTGMN